MQRTGRFVPEGDPRPVIKCRERHTPKVNTFALLCEDGFYTWDLPEGEGENGGVTQAHFHACFMKWVGLMVPNLRKWAKGRKIRFMLDGAGIHGVKKLLPWAEKNKVEFIQNWPSHSPDLNPIENIFSHLKDKIGKELQIYTRKDLENSKKRISAKRNSVAKGFAGKCRSYVKSFKKRLQVCKERKGAHTGY